MYGLFILHLYEDTRGLWSRVGGTSCWVVLVLVVAPLLQSELFGWFTSCRHGAKAVGSNQQVELTWPAPHDLVCPITIFLRVLGFLHIKKELGFLMWMQFAATLLETCFICLLIKLWYSTQWLHFSYSSVCLFVCIIYCWGNEARSHGIVLIWIFTHWLKRKSECHIGVQERETYLINM